MLLAAFAAAPAQADQANDILAATLSAISAGSPQSSYGTGTSAGTSAPAGGEATPTAQQDNTASNTQTATAAGGAGGSATAGTAQGSQSGNAQANGGNAESHNSLVNGHSNQGSQRQVSPNNGGSDVVVLETAKPRRSSSTVARGYATHSPGDAKSAKSRAALKHARADGKTKALPVGGGRPGEDGQLPGQAPFFSVLSGSAGSSAGLMFLLLAILGASIALPRDRFKPFRTPAVTWRPPAYVPPIELPG